MTTSVSSAFSQLPEQVPQQLATPWSFWFMVRNGRPDATNYEHSMHQVATLPTLDAFTTVYSHLRRPRDMPQNSDYHFFRAGIKPVWEDERNSKGGKWMVRLRKGLSSRLWEHLLMAVMGEQIKPAEQVCGIVLSMRYQEDIISLWTCDAADEAAKAQLGDDFKRLLCLPPSTVIEYKAHDQSMRDHSSYRNTKQFK